MDVCVCVFMLVVQQRQAGPAMDELYEKGLLCPPPFPTPNKLPRLCVSLVPSLTLTAPAVRQQPVALWARAAVGARDIHARVDAQLPATLRLVHLTLVHIWGGGKEKGKGG